MAEKRIGQAVEVITLADARSFLRLVPFGNPLSHPDDALILGLIAASRQWVEGHIERTIANQTFELALDKFPTSIELKPYVQSITTIKYIDINGIEQTISAADYTLDNYSTTNWVTPAFGKSFPAVQDVANAVKVRYVAGYDVNNPVPQLIVSAMLLIIGHLYENRQQNIVGMSVVELPMGVEYLLQTYRLYMGV